MAKRRVNRVREEAVAYGARSSGIVVMPWSTLDVGERYMEKLKAKAKSVSQALQKAGVPHAVVDGLAVEAFVRKVNCCGIRNSLGITILLRRGDIGDAEGALRILGFRYRKDEWGAPILAVSGDQHGDAIHLVLAGEDIGPGHLGKAPVPCAENTVVSDDGFAILDLPALLRLFLARFRIVDQLYVEDLLDAGVLKKDFVSKLPSRLQTRLREIRDRIKRERSI